MKYEINYKYIEDCLNETFSEYNINAVARHYDGISSVVNDKSYYSIYLFDATRDANQVVVSKKPFASISVSEGKFTFYNQSMLPTDEDLGLVMREVYELIDEVYPKNYWKASE